MNLPIYKVYQNGAFVGEMTPMELLKYRLQNDVTGIQVKTKDGRWIFD